MLNPVQNKQSILAMSVSPQSLVSYNLLGPFLLLFGFEAMSKKAQQP